MRIWLSAAALAVGAALLAASALAAQPTPRQGGTLRVVMPTDIDYVDPALAYYMASWQIEYATCLKLYNHPDDGGARSAALVPEAASGPPRVSRDGLTYTFRVRTSHRFSDGTRVGALNFQFALNRVLNRRMWSPAQQFFSDIVGARAVIEGTAQKVAGIRVLPRNRLQIRLEARAPDLLSRLAMPFACALKTDTPLNPDGIPAPVVAAGPYYIAAWTPKRSIIVRRNRFYRGPRPHNVDAIEYRIVIDPRAAFDAVERGEADWLPEPRPSVDERFATSPLARVNQTLGTRIVSFNTREGPFRNTALRQAAALAINRAELAAADGPRRSAPTDHFLPPTMPGHRQDRAYPLTTTPQMLERARELAAPYVPATVRVFDVQTRSYDALTRQLARIGIDVQFAQRVACFWPCLLDLRISSVLPDYQDPAAVLGPLINATSPRQAFPDPRWTRRLKAADRLGPKARLAALGQLDLDLARTAVPAAAYATGNSRQLFSERTGCFRFHRVYHVDLAALCLR